jgi:hypothetical protein
MPDLTLKAQVGGFGNEFMAGECADRSGNIWVTGDDEYAGGELIKLAHNGQLLGSIQIYNDQPYSCAVDPTTGNLAVTENGYNYYNPGAVVIFARARGTGKVITNPQQFFYRFDGYDTSGNLWEDGSGSGFILSRCSASSCSTIPISGGKIYGAGFVQWAVGQKSWYIGDVACNNLRVFCIYPVSRSGRLRTPIQLSDPQGHSICQTSQAVITSAKSRSLVGSFYDYNCGGDYGVARWNFPAGGLPTNFTTDVFGEGAAISYK